MQKFDISLVDTLRHYLSYQAMTLTLAFGIVSGKSKLFNIGYIFPVVQVENLGLSLLPNIQMINIYIE